MERNSDRVGTASLLKLLNILGVELTLGTPSTGTSPRAGSSGPGTVYFESSEGTDVRAWSPSIETEKLQNFVLSGDPRTSKWIEITVQLNFPAGTYNRRMAGAFIKDVSGDVFIAHRGKLTKGKAGLPKAQVFREFAPWTVKAADSSKTSTRDFLRRVSPE